MALVEAGCLDELDVLFHLLLGLEVEELRVGLLERHVLRRISYGLHGAVVVDPRGVVRGAHLAQRLILPVAL